MKIVCISDTHGQHRSLDGIMPEGDVLVHAGDLTSSGRLAQLLEAAAWLDEQFERYAHVVCIAGNHDFAAEAFYKEGFEAEMRAKMFPDVHYLRDSGVMIDGNYFYGSPWTPRFFDWAFNADRGHVIKQYWSMIPMRPDVLVTHGPPMGILDRVGYEHVGCADLRIAVARVAPTLHVFGHIHCGYGQLEMGGTKFLNASVVNERYHVVNKPIVIEI